MLAVSISETSSLRSSAQTINQEKQKADAAAAAKARSDGPPNKKAKTDEVGFHVKHDMSSMEKTLMKR